MELSAAMQEQARALADPSRFRIFAHIAAAPGPVLVAELTELMGFNHNAIRQHLAILVDAGLVVADDEERTSRGRPRKQYQARADALAAFGSVSGSYERLASLLLDLASGDDDPYQVGFQAGRRESGPTSADVGLLRDLTSQLAVQGFEPRPTEDGVELGHCPFADVAARQPGIVCELHRGLIDGRLAGLGVPERSELVVRNAHEAGCLVRLPFLSDKHS